MVKACRLLAAGLRERCRGRPPQFPNRQPFISEDSRRAFRPERHDCRFGLEDAVAHCAMSSPQEFELKFGIPAERLSAVKKALARGIVRNERLRAVYVDSEDEVLARSRIALRLRKEGRIWVQTLKASTDQSVRRLEDNSHILGAAGAAVPALDLSRHDTSSAGEVLRAALASEPHRNDHAAADLPLDIRANHFWRTARLVTG